MKKLFCLFLLLLLPSLALAETADSGDLYLEPTTLTFGDFTISAFTIDGVQMNEKADGAVWGTIYPLYNPDATFHDSISIMWFQADESEVVDTVGADFYVEASVKMILEQFASQGITATNAQLLNYAYEDRALAMYYTMDVDFSGAGTDLQVTMWQLQHYTMTPNNGTYVFTLTADSMDDLELLSYYLNTVVFADTIFD